MIEALLRIVTSFLTMNCPQKPAMIDTAIRYKAANSVQANIQLFSGKIIT